MWYYLESETYKSRYALAAHFLKKCSTIIEIGGHKSTIDKFIADKSKRIIVCDPLIKPLERNNLHYVKSRFQDIDFSEYTDFGLCFMGLENIYNNKMRDLVEKSNRVVIEHATNYPAGKSMATNITNNTAKKIIIDIDLDFRGSTLQDVTPEKQYKNSLPWPDRKILVLE